ncbi:hypothetical protein SDC9_182118 [bioreactor metagenome]|uniref:Uncharacterized protein n=1 Tax=bioreactor metagenome TaxID=1076179 RepID=A0A645HEU4_9ZZZZ
MDDRQSQIVARSGGQRQQLVIEIGRKLGQVVDHHDGCGGKKRRPSSLRKDAPVEAGRLQAGHRSVGADRTGRIEEIGDRALREERLRAGDQQDGSKGALHGAKHASRH